MPVTIVETIDSLQAPPGKCVIITDDTVKELFGHQLAKQLDCPLLNFPHGEENKTLETVQALCKQLVALGVNRRTTLITLGGGLVGDLAGFTASCYMRGLTLIHIPTTLLAMVDSSIGGKVGVNLPEGKNLIGAFYQPKDVIIPLEALRTLPDRELHSGLSEVIKYAVIGNPSFFEWLEENLSALLRKDLSALRYAIKQCTDQKLHVVSLDEKEGNLRQILNYGHTIGHALESLTRYTRYTHGEAIAFGMKIEGQIAGALTGFSHNDLTRQNRLLDQIHPRFQAAHLGRTEWIEAMMRDKKIVSNHVICALPSCIGKMATHDKNYGIEVSQKAIDDALHPYYS